MLFIIRHKFNISDRPYYVRLVDTEIFEEVYDPYYANRFDSEENAKKWVETYSNMEKYSKIVELSSAIFEYQQWSESGTVRRTLPCINTKMSRPYNNESLDEVIDWWIYTRRNENSIKMGNYQTWPILSQISKHLWEVNGFYDKNYKNMYITFEIYTNKDGNFNEFEKEINLVIDKVEYKNDDGYKVFPIFDHYLSEGGDKVCLLIHPETKDIKIGGIDTWSRKISFNSLEDAFNYMKEERYYE
jgi:hypothetical protein